MLLNHKGNTLIESLFALSIYLMIVVYFVGSLTVLNKAQLRFRYAQENSNKQELRIIEEMISNQNSKRLYAHRNVVVFKYLLNDCLECILYHTCLKGPCSVL